MLDIVSGLKDILYISTCALRQLDPNLHTFLNINTPSDLVRAENILKTMQ
jgi:GTP:adenosylcobinamide-phosphate guanylyltransferase